ncbi:MAG TPA: hypothetical protein VGE36_05410 [Roseateles sp.]
MIVKRRNPWPLLMACACLLAPPLAQANLLKLLGIGPQAELARLDERCKVLVDWGGQHLGPRPAPAPRQPFRGAAVAAPNAMQQFPELRLFADERFRPVFGKPFDALQPSERLAL